LSTAIDLDRPPGFPQDHPGTVLTVGTFDGVHRGHWEVLGAVRQRADQEQLPAVLVTFHPHPLRVVRPDHAPRLLTTPVEKKEILAESGLDYAVFLPFNEALRGYSPQRFVEEILVGRLRMKHLVIGYDHGFGHGRSGDAETLRRIGATLGFQVHVIRALRSDGAAISSSRIRKALADGHVHDAALALGRPYSLRGPVVRGDGRGSSLGFPTANIHVPDDDKLLPLAGVYVVTATLRSGVFRGVLHLGPRPMFQGSPPSIELHILDFDGDLYGEEIRVDFCARLRDIHRYATIADLVDAIRQDCQRAIALFETSETPCAPPHD
jgi:riboflavin kinase / FMN adenylyltransferase